MDLSILKKKISTFRSDGGKIRNVSDEVLEEIIHSWENWPGSSSKFYSSIGLDSRKAASLIGKAKRLKRKGLFAKDDFTEVKIIDHNVQSISLPHTSLGIEIVCKSSELYVIYGIR